MGKRKKSSRKPQGPRKNAPLDTVFTCLFCNHEKSVSVKMDKRAGVGELDCKTCHQSFQCGINYLSAPIDVYSEWVDAADNVARKDADIESRSTGGAAKPSRRPQISSRPPDDNERRYEGEGIVADDDEYD